MSSESRKRIWKRVRFWGGMVLLVVGIGVLLYVTYRKSLGPPPKWITPTGKAPELTPGKVTVTVLLHPWCQDACTRLEQAKRVAESFDGELVLNIIDTTDRDTFRAWGIENAIFIGDEQVPCGPDFGEETIKTMIRKKLEGRQ